MTAHPVTTETQMPGVTPPGRVNGTNGHQPDMHWPTMARVTPTYPPVAEPTDKRAERALARIAVAERKAAAKRAERQAQEADKLIRASARRAARRKVWADRRQTGRKIATAVGTVIPLLVVNGVAVYGQVSYAFESLTPRSWDDTGRLVMAAAIAAAIEVIAVYVGWHAHDALLEKAYGSAQRLRRASYTIAAVVGAMNYAHFAGPRLTPTAGAFAFGLLSMLSPWLWGLHTRRLHNIQLRSESATFDRAGVVFDPMRVREFPIRSWAARRWSIDRNVTDPIEAWDGYKADRARRRADKELARARQLSLSVARSAVESAARAGDTDRAVDELRTFVSMLAASVGSTPDRLFPGLGTDSIVGPDGRFLSVGLSTNRSVQRRVSRRLARARSHRLDRRQIVGPRTDCAAPVSTDSRVGVATGPEQGEQAVSDRPEQAVSVGVDRPRRRASVGRQSVGRHTPAAVANAAELRVRYPDRLPSTDAQIRTDTGWSYDRVKAARAAYRAGADRKTDISTDNPT